MKIEIAFLVGVLLGSLMEAQPRTGADSSRFAGVWEAERIYDLPALQLTIERSENAVNGTVVSHLQTRKDVTEPWRVTGETSLKLLSPVVKGKTLSFEVPHQSCHGCVERGPNAKVRMELTGPSEALMEARWRGDERGRGPGAGAPTLAASKTDSHAEGILMWELVRACMASLAPID